MPTGHTGTPTTRLAAAFHGDLVEPSQTDREVAHVLFWPHGQARTRHRPVEEIDLRELRQQASDVVRRAETGTEFIVTVAGRAAARLTRAGAKTWCSGAELDPIFTARAWGDDADTRMDVDQSVRDPWHGPG